MARKVRRVRKKPSPDRSESATSSQENQLREEYSYVLKDLRHIFILAAIMFALLIALNIIL